MPSYQIPLFIDRQGRIRKSRTFPTAYSTTDLLVLKRGDFYTFSIGFLDSNLALTPLDSPSHVKVAAKEKEKFDGSDFIIFGESEEVAVDDFYLISVNTNTVALNELLASDGNSSNDVPFVDLMFEVSWTEGVGENTGSTLAPVTVRIYNDVIRGGEGTPEELPTPEEWLEGQLDAMLIALGVPKYANIAAANAALSIGLAYYDEELQTINIVTA